MPGLAAAVGARAQPAQRRPCRRPSRWPSSQSISSVPAARSAWIVAGVGMRPSWHAARACAVDAGWCARGIEIWRPGPSARARCRGSGAILAAVSLEIDHVTKRFGVDARPRRPDVRGPERGEVFGFLGANGAGKTTTMRICLGILQADAGEIRWDGEPVTASCRAGPGATCPRSAASTRGWPSSTSSSTSPRCTASRAASARREALGLAGPVPHRRATPAGAPRSSRRATSRRSSSSPRSSTSREVLLMDEPFTGLDPVNLVILREAFLELRDRGPDPHLLDPPDGGRRGAVRIGRDRRPRPAWSPAAGHAT